jgi:hypothetical protein
MINPDELKHLVENNPKIIRANRSVRYPELRVVKYKNKVFYNNLWNEHPLLVKCRGLVIDDDYNVVVRPFTKIFNRGENGTDIPRDELCTVVQKVNGFLGVLTKWKGQGIVSTTGTLDSDYAQLAETYIADDAKKMEEGSTALYEIVDPSDPHIIEEKYGSHLIGFNYKNKWWSENELDVANSKKHHGLGNHRPIHYSDMRFSDAVKMAKEAKHEGYVVYGETINLKLKSPYYLTTKLFARMKGQKLLDILQNNRPLRIDEDYLPVVEHLRTVASSFVELKEQQRVKYVREYIEKEILK